jgi:ribosomal protein S18 acetylase RimI-like enzyme
MDIELLDKKKHNRKDFDCGDISINDYLKKFANQDMENGTSRTYILCHTEDKSHIIGYFTTAVGQIKISLLPEDLRKKFGNRETLPVLVLARLGVSVQYQSEGVGSYLVSIVIREAIDSYFQGVGLILDVLEDENTALRIQFYNKLGFEELPRTEKGKQMFLSKNKMKGKGE